MACWQRWKGDEHGDERGVMQWSEYLVEGDGRLADEGGTVGAAETASWFCGD